MKKISLYILLFFLLAYVLYSSGMVHSGDALWQYFTGEALVTHGSFDLNPIVPEWNHNPGKPLYAYNTIGTSFLFIPFIILDKVFDVKTVKYTLNGIYVNKFYFGSFMTAVVGALMALIFFRFSMLLIGNRKASVLSTLLFGLGTYTFYYSIIWRDIMPSMAGLFLSLYLIFLYKQSKKDTLLLWSGLSLGFAGFCRNPAFLIAVVYFFYLAYILYRDRTDMKRAVKCLAFFSGGIIFFGLFQGYFNYLKFGNFFQLFEKVASDPSVSFSLAASLKHMLSYLFSPGAGVFFYSPLLILSVPGFILFYKKDKGLFWVMLSTVLVTWLFYSLLAEPYWSGAIRGEYGNRYINSIIAFIAFPIGFFLLKLFESAFWKKKAVKIIFYSLVVLTVLFELLVLSVNSRLMIQVNWAEHPDYTDDNITYKWVYSPLLRSYNRGVYVLDKTYGIRLLPSFSFVKDYSPYMPENFNFWYINFSDIGAMRFLAFLFFVLLLFSGYKIYRLSRS